MDRGADIAMESLSAAQLKSDKLRRLLEFWQRLRGSRSLPFRSEFAPEQLESLLGQVSLVQVMHDPLTFRFRLVGTRIEEAGRRGDQNKTLDQIEPASYRDTLSAAFGAAATSAEPVINLIKLRDTRRVFHYEQLVLPFTVEGEGVDMLLHGIDWPPDVAPSFETDDTVKPRPTQRRRN